MFKSGKTKRRTSVNLNTSILDALDILSARSGDSVSEIVADVLDQYLTEMVRQKFLEPPKDSDGLTLAVSSEEDVG